MNTGLYAACAGLLARTQALDLAANNLANLNTNGYKGQFASFQALLAGEGSSGNEIQDAVSRFGVLEQTRNDFAQGSLEHTGSDLDFAIQGEGWFVLQHGSERLYTRNGNFHVDTNGHLAAADGSLVQGDQGPITIPPGKLSVSPDGTISVDGALAGQLTVVTFPAGTPLARAGNSSFTTDAKPVTATASLVQGALEGSNVNAVAAAVALVGLQRNMEFLQQAIATFHSNMNRIAAQDLSRV